MILDTDELIFIIIMAMIVSDMLRWVLRPVDTRVARWLRKKFDLKHDKHDLKPYEYTNQFGDHIIYRCRDCKTNFTIQDMSGRLYE